MANRTWQTGEGLAGALFVHTRDHHSGSLTGQHLARRSPDPAATAWTNTLG